MRKGFIVSVEDGGVYEMDPDADTPAHLKLFRFLGRHLFSSLHF